MNRLLVLIALIALSGCTAFIGSDHQTYQYFQKRGLEATIGYDSTDVRTARWVEVSTLKEDSVPIVIFVHGAPGAANNFFQFLSDTTLLKYARLISIDRLGYAPFDQGQAEVSIQKQSEVIGRVLKHYKYPWVVVVGHSFGGPIVANYVLQHPRKVKAAILLAPALDPDNEKHFPIIRLTEWKATRWAVPAFLMVAAAEKKAHVEELRKMLPEWKLVRTPFVHVHGTKDKIVPYENLKFSERVIDSRYLRTVSIPKGNHLLPWSAKELVRDEILKWIE